MTTTVVAAPNESKTDTKPWKPTVLMTDAHRTTCRVFQGDPFPDLALLDLDGDSQNIGQLLGKNLSVVLFWTSKHPYALEQFQNLTRDVVKPFADQGVALIAINEGDSVAEIKKFHSDDSGFVNLRDEDTTALEKIATGGLPRTFLLDNTGKILWMDIEYSQSTRRELRNALRYFGQESDGSALQKGEP